MPKYILSRCSMRTFPSVNFAMICLLCQNKMEEMSQQQASMLTDMAREREVNKEALTQAKREIAQLKVGLKSSLQST